MKAGQKQTGKTDTVLWVLVLILVVLGLGALFSASEYNGRVRFHDSAYYFKKQLFATALGLLVMYLASRVDYRLSVKLAPAAYIFSLFLSAAVLLFGQEINGSKRWLNLGPLSFQPSEFSKVAVILFLVWQISNTKSKTTGFWFICRTMMTLLPVAGLVGSNNLSTAVIILGFRDKSQLLQTVPEPLAEDPSASDRIQALYSLKSFFIFFRIPPDCQAFQTITLRGKKNRNKSYPRTSKCEKLQMHLEKP